MITDRVPFILNLMDLRKIQAFLRAKIKGIDRLAEKQRVADGWLYHRRNKVRKTLLSSRSSM